MRADPAEDVIPAVLAKPPSVKLFTTLPSPRVSALRRRAALGSMVAASSVLFALPWLTSRRPGVLPQAGDERVAQADTSVSSPAVADDEASELPDVTITSTDLPEQPEVADAAPSPHAAPTRRADPALPGGHRGVVAFEAPVLFRGQIFNETMGQRGHVRLVIHKQAPTGAITARFDASQGLSGTGTLAGRVSESGRITATGQLLMGKNPFLCDFIGTLNGDTLVGSASFVRSGNSRVYYSRFNLIRV